MGEYLTTKIPGDKTALLARWALFFACAAAAADLLSIAGCQILTGASLGVLLITRSKLRLPPIKLPLALFFAGTILSVLASSHPADGLPQIKKFYVWVILLVLTSTLRRIDDARVLWFTCSATATINSIWGIRQYVLKHAEAERLGRDFYLFYIGDRIKGFQSHWMTFSGLEMIAFLMLISLLLFAPIQKWGWMFWGFAGIMLLGIVLSDTRGVWIATAGGAIYLIALWKPKMLLLLPFVFALCFFAAPQSVKQRVMSIYKPSGTSDSNEFRRVTRIIGWQIIKAHPLLGVGPEEVGRHYREYVPATVSQPLPAGYYGHLHSIYVHYAAERGVPTMLALMWMLGKILFDFWRASIHAIGARKSILHGAIAVTIAILIEGFVELNLGDSEVLALFLAAVACGYAAIGAAAQPEEPEHA